MVFEKRQESCQCPPVYRYSAIARGIKWKVVGEVTPISNPDAHRPTLIEIILFFAFMETRFEENSELHQGLRTPCICGSTWNYVRGCRKRNMLI